MRLVLGSGTPLITSGSSYATGQAIGSTITIPRVADFGFETILSVALIDRSDQKAPIDILIFSQAPTTPQVDKTAVSVSNADASNLVGHISILGADYSDLTASAVATKYNLWMAAAGGMDNNLYIQLVTRGGTPIYTSTSALTVKITSQVDPDH